MQSAWLARYLSPPDLFVHFSPSLEYINTPFSGKVGISQQNYLFPTYSCQSLSYNLQSFNVNVEHESLFVLGAFSVMVS